MLYAHVCATTRLESWTQVSAPSPLSWLLFGQGWRLMAISCNLTQSASVLLWSDTTKAFCTCLIIFAQLFHAELVLYVQHAHGYFHFVVLVLSPYISVHVCLLFFSIFTAQLETGSDMPVTPGAGWVYIEPTPHLHGWSCNSRIWTSRGGDRGHKQTRGRRHDMLQLST